MTPAEVAAHYSVTVQTQLAWRKAGLLPEVIRMKKRIYYREAEIMALNKNQVSINKEQ